MAELEILSMGDASFDVFLTPTESEAYCTIDEREAFICFTYGDKIPVKTFETAIGGNAANNAVGVNRLGVTVGVVLTLGDDAVGNQILKRLQDEGVDTSYVILQPATASNYSTVINYQGERTIFTFKAPRSYEFPVKLPKTSWVYLTSMGDSFRPFYNHVAEWLLKNPEIKLGFNPGSRQIRAGQTGINNILKLTEIIFINRSEAETLSGLKETQGKEKELLKAVAALGPKKVVVTDGGNGSYAFDGDRFIKAGVLPIDAYERTGAGDAFGSGTLSAVIKGKDLKEALLWGTANSASVIGYIGSQKGLIKEADMPTWLERAKSSQVKVEEF